MKADLTTSLKGIITVLNTPFTETGEIDGESVRRNVLRAAEAGVAGFLVPALAGEVGKLTLDERVELVRTVLDTLEDREYEEGGPVPVVIGGATASSPRDRLLAAEALSGLGCDGILAAIPFTDEAAFESEVREIADFCPDFLMLQDWDPNGPGLPVPLIARLFRKIDAFRALKIETVPAGAKYSEVLRATNGRLHVSGGWAVTQMIEGLDRGVHAFMPTGLHEVYCEIYRRYVTGDRPAAVELFRRLLPVLSFSNQHLDISIRFFKRLLWREGTYATSLVREPLLPFDAIHESVADELIEYAMRLTREV